MLFVIGTIISFFCVVMSISMFYVGDIGGGFSFLIPSILMIWALASKQTKKKVNQENADIERQSDKNIYASNRLQSNNSSDDVLKQIQESNRSLSDLLKQSEKSLNQKPEQYDINDLTKDLNEGKFTKFMNVGETEEIPDATQEELTDADIIADGITTPQELSELGRGVSYLDFNDPRRIAYYKACRKPYGYYIKFGDFPLNLKTVFYYEYPTENIINSIGEIIDPQDYRALTDTEKSFFKKITLEDYNYSKGRFKTLVKDGITKNGMAILELFRIYYSHDADKELKFNNFVSKNDFLKTGFNTASDFYKEFTDEKDTISKIQNLQGLPSSTAFVKAGYENLEDIEKLSDEQILSIKGIGAKKLTEIKNFLTSRKK
nr:MAG TPA: bacterial RNA polymerase [Caudoviricetes sp.]